MFYVLAAFWQLEMEQLAGPNPYMVARVLAYCLEYTEGIAFTEGVAAGDEPAVVVRDLTGRMTAWIEVGMPDASPGDTPVYEKTVVGIPGGPQASYDPPPAAEGAAGQPSFDKTAAFTKPEGGNGPGA